MTISHKPENVTSLPSIAVFYPSFEGGGAESVGLWILEALKHKYKVTLFTLFELDFKRLNSAYGTQLSSETVRIQSMLPKFIQSSLDFLIANNPSIKKLINHYFIRQFKAQTQNYDLVLSGYNAADLGKSGIQYIHWIDVFDKDESFYKKISDFSDERMKSNHSIANSYVVADAILTEYGIESTVIYPPVVLDVQQIAWENKENAFICSGRLTEAKQPHKAIQILKKIREKGYDVKLYLTGGGGGFYGLKYLRFLKKMVAENADWVTLYQNLPYKDYISILAKCRYGIHYKKEPFGISIAEMVKAGAIPFVRSVGGQIEIVGQDNQDLFFDSVEEAVEKILLVLNNSEKQQQLRTALEDRQKIFSTEHFMKEICEFVDNDLQLSHSAKSNN
ncbi:glycosyltransferase [Limnoraphis robusta Tam1]|uniref:glycosyltransferase n=1 Tax=Limnoraphis robusta TaxID=1118279 RepID=UPI002B1EA7FD|nr:glycosyltransferase [Limnoraphis robusta]MEA5542790.1 glycosyltransferase [Limnoraphis robusta Tam1]